MIGSYLSILRRWWWLVLPLAMALPPVFYTVLVPTAGTYESEAVVQTNSGIAESVLDVSRPFQELESRLATELEIFNSHRVAETAAEQLRQDGWDVGTADELSERVEATPRGSSSLLEIVGTADGPEEAQAVTSAFVTAYIQQRREIDREALESIQADLQEQLTAAEEELAELDEALAQAGSEAETDAIERRQASALSRYDSIANRMRDAQLRLAVETGGVSLLSAPSVPEDPARPITPTLAAVLSVIAGVVLACGVAFLLDLVRNPLRTRGEVQAVFPGRAVAELPRPAAASHPRAWELALLDAEHPTSAAARGLRLRLGRLATSSAPRPEPAQRVLLTGTASDSDDLLLVAAALAAAWGRAGTRTVVVADPVAEFAESVLAHGPADDAMLTVAGLDVRATALPGVWWLPATTSREHGRGLYDTPSPARAVEALSRAFDAVVLAEPVVESFAGVAVRDAVDRALVVVALGRTSGRRMQHLVANLDEQGVSVDGMVLVRPLSRALRRRRGEQRAAADDRLVHEAGDRAARSEETDRELATHRALDKN